MEVSEEALNESLEDVKKPTKKRNRTRAASALSESLDAALEDETRKDDDAEVSDDVKPAVKKSGRGGTPNKRKKTNEGAAPVKRDEHPESIHSLATPEIEKMQLGLLAWYDKVRGCKSHFAFWEQED